MRSAASTHSVVQIVWGIEHRSTLGFVLCVLDDRLAEWETLFDFLVVDPIEHGEGGVVHHNTVGNVTLSVRFYTSTNHVHILDQNDAPLVGLRVSREGNTLDGSRFYIFRTSNNGICRTRLSITRSIK